MIVRILSEGQWDVPDEVVKDLNRLDEVVEQAVRSGDQSQLTAALGTLLDEVRSQGSPVPDERLDDSDLILPAADSTLEDVQALLNDSEEGLIPG
jgi:hypothetical protein